MGTVPVGGFKVVYEYANGLASRGWRVRVVHPCMLHPEEISSVRASIPRRTRRWLGYQRRRITKSYRPDRWFHVHPKIELICTKTPDSRYLPPTDILVATAWDTAPWVASNPASGVYLIQHLETWCGPEKDVMATWKLPLHKVVISRWLEDIAADLGEASAYIPNGLDFDAFGIDLSPANRNPNTAAMLYHHSDWKGSSDGLKALCTAKKRVPALTAELFGLYPCPADLPNWIRYHQNPPQRELRRIYNDASIFLSPSWAEGWPLPPAEALQCGAALAATNIGGHREYALHEETALLSEPKNPDALALNLIRLLEDQTLRLRLANRGHEYIQQFTWDRAVTSFETVLHDAIITRKPTSRAANLEATPSLR